ncbi:MAG: molybdate ABC transporter substrate-binding protein [Erythrobacter sp.]|nr:molybdate ABC transporter substrate-binding protein [Erythrobacter sp.]
MARGMVKQALAAIFMLLSACAPSAQQGPVVLAASSMTEALEEAADLWAAEGHPHPQLSFSASSTVARQAAEGAPADLVVTADAEWMDWMAGEGLLRPGTRGDIAGNALVLVAGSDDTRSLSQDPAAALQAMTGRLAIAEPEAVPAGRYAMAALTRLGLADGVAQRLVPAENVRAALALVERGEAELGIVYASDAQASQAVRVVATFAADLHPPIRYPVAVLARSDNADSEGFAAFLASEAGQAVLLRHGFTRPD